MTHPVRDSEPIGNIQREAMRGQFFGLSDIIDHPGLRARTVRPSSPSPERGNGSPG